MTQSHHHKRGTQASEPKHSIPEQLREEIQLLVYQLYCQCGHEHGHDLDHWVEAERRVLERHQGRRKTVE